MRLAADAGYPRRFHAENPLIGLFGFSRPSPPLSAALQCWCR